MAVLSMEGRKNITDGNCYVSGSLAAVLRVSRFAGLAPLTFDREWTGWRVTRSPVLRIYGIILMAILISGTVATLIEDHRLDPESSIMIPSRHFGLVYTTNILLNIVIATVSVCGAWSQMETVMICLNQVQKINSDLNIYHWPTFLERKKMKLLIFYVISTLTLTMADLALIAMKSRNKISFRLSLQYTFVYGIYGVVKLQVLQFVMITMLILNTFIVINDDLRKLLHMLLLSDAKRLPLIPQVLFQNQLIKRNESKKKRINRVGVALIPAALSILQNGSDSCYRHHATVRDLAVAFTKISRVVGILDKFYGKILILMLGASLLQLIVSPLYLIYYLSSVNGNENSILFTILVVVQMLWCFYHVLNLIVINEPCQLTITEIEITRMLVNYLMSCTTSIYEPLAVQLDVFYRHLVLIKTSYSPLQLTTLTRSRTLSIIGAVTTYLVIIVQL